MQTIRQLVKAFTFLIWLLVIGSIVFPSYTFSLSDEQKKLFDSGIHYFDAEESCSPLSGNRLGSVSGSSLSTAEQIGAFSGPQITPTAIILHWTAGEYNSPQELVNTLKSRVEPGYPNGRSVQLTIDKEGKVYQLSKTLETRPMQTMADQGWNDVSIGIEIESGSFPNDASPYPEHENDILNNSAQLDSVLNVVNELMTKYGIKNTSDIAGKKGVFGHYEANAGNPDPGPNYMAKIRTELNNVTSDGASISTTAAFTNCVCAVASGSNNAEIAFNFLLSKGLSREQAAGIVGNLQTESGQGVDPQAVSPSGYRGIAQWDASVRWPRLVAFAQTQGKDPLELQTQLDFMWEEATQRGNIEGIKKYNDVPHSAWYWGRFFEVAIVGGSTSETPLTNVQHLEKRIRYAEIIYSSYSGTDASAQGSCAGLGGVDRFPLDTTKDVIVSGSSNPSGTLRWLYDRDNCYHHDYCAADIHVPPGTVVVAAKSGTVKRAKEILGGGGSSLQIVGDDEQYLYYYTHMAYGSLLVSDGDKVTVGQPLGIVGEYTQAVGTAPHLHFDMLPYDKFKFRPSCSGAACSGLPFINVQSILKQLYQSQIAP